MRLEGLWTVRLDHRTWSNLSFPDAQRKQQDLFETEAAMAVTIERQK